MMARELPCIVHRKLRRQVGQLFLLLCYVAIFSGCVTQQASKRNLPLAGARLSLDQARKTQADPSIAIGHYLDAADASLRLMSSTPVDEATDARLTYNSACQEMAVLLRSNNQVWNRPQTIHSGDHVYQLRFARGSRRAAIWDPNYFDLILKPKRLRTKLPIDTRRTNGWGGMLVGVHKPADPRKYFLPLVGLAVPVTATIDFTQPSSKAGVRYATLSIYAPAKREGVAINGVQRELAANFAAPYAYYPNPKLLGIQALMQPEKYKERAGLYVLEPYDPEKIPIVFVHGLLSIPQMWVPTITAIQSDHKLHGRFQFWVFAYPTGDPILLSALRLRESLARIYQLYPRTKGLILVGHSMGGLLSRMQAVRTGRTLWNAVFQNYADRLYATIPPDNVAKKMLIFDPNPHVKRIIFICVPHRGSYLASNWIGAIGISLIRAPSSILSRTFEAITATLPGESLRTNLGLKRLPTGISGLSPRNPVLRSLDTLPIAAPYHSIIGDRGRGDTPHSSDGVVAYWSSHLAGAQSELIVPGPHSSYALPQTIAELKRILRKQLATLERNQTSGRRVAALQHHDTGHMRWNNPAPAKEPAVIARTRSLPMRGPASSEQSRRFSASLWDQGPIAEEAGFSQNWYGDHFAEAFRQARDSKTAAKISLLP
jgi:pimeloyl-ACP methyl ester carboxylesterase